MRRVSATNSRKHLTPMCRKTKKVGLEGQNKNTQETEKYIVSKVKECLGHLRITDD